MATNDLDPVADPQIPLSHRRWKVGSLTYSFKGLAKLCSWLLWGDFASSVRDRALPTMTQILFKKYGASNLIYGVLSSSWPSALNLVLGPIVGYNSDRVRTRWGRRIPFILVTTPFVFLALFGLAYIQELGVLLHRLLGSHSPGLNPSTLIVLGILITFLDVSLIIGGTVFGGLVNDVVPQKVVGRFFGLWRAVSLFAGILFFFGLNKVVEAHVREIFLVVAAINGIGVMLMCIMVKEGEYPPPPKSLGPRGSPLTPIITYFRDGFGHSYYLVFFASSIFGGLTAAPFNMYSLFYSQTLSVSMSTYFDCLGLTYVFSLLLAWPLGWLADYFHPLRTTIASLVLYAGAMAYGFLFAHDARVFAIAMVVHGVTAGVFNTSAASLGQRLLPRAKFTEIASAGGILGSLVGIVFAPVMGALLDFSHQDYRYTFLAGFVFTVLAIIAYSVLHHEFMALGGPKHYKAPE